MNEKRLCKSLDALMWFIDDSLGISRKENNLNGFDFIVPFLESVAYNSYLENVSNKTDTIHLRIKESLISMVGQAYLNYIKIISKNISLSDKKVVLAFDYTEEDQWEFVKKQNPENVWTMVWAEDSYAIIPGFHWVNRDSYFVTEKSVEKEDLSSEYLVI